MANLKLSATLRNNMLDEITSYAGTSATIKIYSGTQPAGGGTVTTLLATLTADVTAFAPAASAGVLTLNGVTGATAVATGTGAWFRLESSGATWVMDGDVGLISAGVADLQFDSVSIVLNGSVALGGPNSVTAPNAA